MHIFVVECGFCIVFELGVGFLPFPRSSQISFAHLVSFWCCIHLGVVCCQHVLSKIPAKQWHPRSGNPWAGALQSGAWNCFPQGGECFRADRFAAESLPTLWRPSPPSPLIGTHSHRSNGGSVSQFFAPSHHVLEELFCKATNRGGGGGQCGEGSDGPVRQVSFFFFLPCPPTCFHLEEGSTPPSSVLLHPSTTTPQQPAVPPTLEVGVPKVLRL